MSNDDLPMRKNNNFTLWYLIYDDTMIYRVEYTINKFYMKCKLQMNCFKYVQARLLRRLIRLNTFTD